MTVAELIEHLKTADPTALVCIRSDDGLYAIPIANCVASGSWKVGPGWEREPEVYNCVFIFESDTWP